MYFVSITRLRVRHWRYLPMFFVYAIRSARQSARAEGNVATRVLKEQRNTFWTATVWSSSETMKKFMLAGVHRRAMRKLPTWCDEAAVAHWTQDASDAPSWREAYERLGREGRASKVTHPSAAHAAHMFPEPRAGRAGELRFR